MKNMAQGCENPAILRHEKTDWNRKPPKTLVVLEEIAYFGNIRHIFIVEMVGKSIFCEMLKAFPQDCLNYTTAVKSPS